MFLEIQRGISKIERRFRIGHRFFEMFRPGYVNALGRKNRPCRPLHKKTRRRIVDRYLTGQGPKGLSGKRGVRSAECGVWKMGRVENAECGKCGVWKTRRVENAECGKCGVWKTRSVENAEC